MGGKGEKNGGHVCVCVYLGGGTQASAMALVAGKALIHHFHPKTNDRVSTALTRNFSGLFSQSHSFSSFLAASIIQAL